MDVDIADIGLGINTQEGVTKHCDIFLHHFYIIYYPDMHLCLYIIMKILLIQYVHLILLSCRLLIYTGTDIRYIYFFHSALPLALQTAQVLAASGGNESICSEQLATL